MQNNKNEGIKNTVAIIFFQLTCIIFTKQEPFRPVPPFVSYRANLRESHKDIAFLFLIFMYNLYIASYN